MSITIKQVTAWGSAQHAGRLEIYNKLVSECSEIIHIVTKILDYGEASFHPNDPFKNNTQLLEEELADLQFVKSLLFKENIVDVENIDMILQQKYPQKVSQLNFNTIDEDELVFVGKVKQLENL